MIKCHRVQSVCHWPSVRQVRLLYIRSIGSFMHSSECFLEPPCWIKGEKFDAEGRGYADVNISTLDVKVLITPMKFKRSNWSQFPHAVLHINLQDSPSVWNTDVKKSPSISYVRDPHHHHSITMGCETLIHKLTQNPGGTQWEGAGLSHPPQFESVKLSSLLYISNTWLTKTELYTNV